MYYGNVAAAVVVVAAVAAPTFEVADVVCVICICHRKKVDWVGGSGRVRGERSIGGRNINSEREEGSKRRIARETEVKREGASENTGYH